MTGCNHEMAFIKSLMVLINLLTVDRVLSDRIKIILLLFSQSIMNQCIQIGCISIGNVLQAVWYFVSAACGSFVIGLVRKNIESVARIRP